MNLSEAETDDDSELEEAAKDQTIQSNQDSFIQVFDFLTFFRRFWLCITYFIFAE